MIALKFPFSGLKLLCEFLTANARLRIVSERVDLFDNLIISVTVFPQSQTCCIKFYLTIQCFIIFFSFFPLNSDRPSKRKPYKLEG